MLCEKYVKNDAMIGYYSPQRKTYKWITKMFFHFFDEAVFNAFITYSKCGGVKRFLQFKVELIHQILNYTGAKSADEVKLSDRLKRRHFLCKIPPTTQKVKAQKRCKVCQKHDIRRDTTFMCETCRSHPPLCPTTCFKIYHTEAEY